MTDKKVAVLIDGGHLRVLAKHAKLPYTADLIEQVAHTCIGKDEEPLRFLYYDCAPYRGTVKLPVSGASHTFDGSDEWLGKLETKDLFAVRRGVLKFRGWQPKKRPVENKTLTDADFGPDFEQKGVDMRIGLDVETYASGRLVQRLILITGDTDCVPAMKHARKLGVQVVLVSFPPKSPPNELVCHSDFKRQLAWPNVSLEV